MCLSAEGVLYTGVGSAMCGREGSEGGGDISFGCGGVVGKVKLLAVVGERLEVLEVRGFSKRSERGTQFLQ